MNGWLVSVFGVPTLRKLSTTSNRHVLMHPGGSTGIKVGIVVLGRLALGFLLVGCLFLLSGHGEFW